MNPISLDDLLEIARKACDDFEATYAPKVRRNYGLTPDRRYSADTRYGADQRYRYNVRNGSR